METTQAEKAARFRALHEGPGILLMPNPHDVGTAKFLASLGFPALATSSAGHAFTRGLPDGGVRFEEMIAHAKEMSAAVGVPTSGDLEKGKGDSAESAAETVFAAEAAGLAGCSIEDFSGDPANPIYDFAHAVERIAAAAEAARSLKGFVLTARAENFLNGRPDLDDTIRRLQAFEAAGADVLFAPGLAEIAQVRAVCAAVGKPVSVLPAPGFRLDGLREAGVRRISVGSRLATLAFAAVERAAREMLDEGTFGFAREAMPFARLQDLFAAGRDDPEA